MEETKEKTREEIESLKSGWRHDPCWDIETTEGFEAHKGELLAYRLRVEQEWEARRDREEKEEMEKWGITDKFTYHRLKYLEYSIDALEKRIEKLEDR